MTKSSKELRILVSNNEQFKGELDEQDMVFLWKSMSIKSDEAGGKNEDFITENQTTWL